MGESLTVNREIRYERRLQSLILNRGIRTTAQVIEILALLNGFVERIYTYVIGSALPNQAHRSISHPKSLWKTKFHVESQGLADYFLSNSYELLSLKLSLGKVFRIFTSRRQLRTRPHQILMWWKCESFGGNNSSIDGVICGKQSERCGKATDRCGKTPRIRPELSKKRSSFKTAKSNHHNFFSIELILERLSFCSNIVQLN